MFRKLSSFGRNFNRQVEQVEEVFVLMSFFDLLFFYFFYFFDLAVNFFFKAYCFKGNFDAEKSKRRRPAKNPSAPYAPRRERLKP
jgi:hypothetical protein